MSREKSDFYLIFPFTFGFKMLRWYHRPHKVVLVGSVGPMKPRVSDFDFTVTITLSAMVT